jgi:hypothetical protein
LRKQQEGIDVFYEGQGGGQFVDFLIMLVENRPNVEIQYEIQGIVETLDELVLSHRVKKQAFLTAEEAK